MNVDFEFLYWGPLVIKFKVEEYITKELLERGEKIKSDDGRLRLAGHIDRENFYTQEDIDWFVKHTNKYFNKYVEHLETVWKPNPPEEFKIEYLKLNSLWVNYMKKNEYNPPHIHLGDISFVLYLDVPEEIKKEAFEFKSLGNGKPGAIEFLYGNEDRYGDYICSHTMFPKTNELYIFPANLHHTVMPFRTNVERISVSGNMLTNRKGL